MPLRTHTPFGTVKATGYGETFYRGSARQLEEWATRPGERWPCSTLRECRRLFVAVDARGNVVDVEHPGVADVDAYELAAWIETLNTLARKD